jgi:YYY domain-containing protein
LSAGYLVWIGASLRVISFRAVWAFVAVGLVALPWLLFRRRLLRRPISRRQRRAAMTSEAVFWLVFVIFLVFRWINPDSWHPFWGGEKPMEFAHINAILRSAHFPPYDPWFADGYINYYYYGLYLVAFCLLASAGFGVASTLSRGLARRRSTGVVGGLAGALLLVGIGNLEAFVQVVHAFPDRLTPTFVGLTWQASRVMPYTIDEFPFFTGLYADLHAHVVALPITVLAIGLCLSLAQDSRAFAVALSDAASPLRARIELAVKLALLVVTLGALFPTNAWDVPVYAALALLSLFMAAGRIRTIQTRFALSGLFAIAIGLFAYVLYRPFHSHYVALFGSVERVRSHSDLWPFLDHLGGLLIVAGFGLVASFVSQRVNTSLFSDLGLAPLAIVGALFVAALVTNDDSSAFASGIRFACVFSVGLLLTGASLPASIRECRLNQLAAGVAGLGLAGTTIAAAADRLVLALMIAFAVGGCLVWLRGEGAHRQFVGALIAAGALVAAGVEVVFLADDLVTTPWYRMNTVFKFYNQVWVLFAIAGGACLAFMLDRLEFGGASERHEPLRLGLLPPAMSSESAPEEAASPANAEQRQSHSPSRSWATMGLVVSSLAVLASVAYPLLATEARLSERFPVHPSFGTLNALDWMRDGVIQMPDGESLSFADDRAVIDWLNDHVDGSPVIAEASIGPYRCNGSRISINTGLPTIIGWERHETQQRYLDGLAERVEDVHDLYASVDTETKLAILRKYDVRFVVVGQLERAYPEIAGNDCVPTNPVAGIAAFDRMIGSSLEIVFQSGSTVLYRVLPPSG